MSEICWDMVGCFLSGDLLPIIEGIFSQAILIFDINSMFTAVMLNVMSRYEGFAAQGYVMGLLNPLKGTFVVCIF